MADVTGPNRFGRIIIESYLDLSDSLHELFEENEDAVLEWLRQKGVEKPIEWSVENALDLAKGIKAAPGLAVGKEIIGGTAGEGEEARIFEQQLLAALAHGDAAAIRFALLLLGRVGIAMTLVQRDP